MSGIAAILQLDGAPVSIGQLQAMADRLAHRGTDGSRFWTNGPVGLAQAWFVTTPEDAGIPPPIQSSAQDLWIVADVRIDNREDLLKRGAALRARGRTFSDAELVLWAYEEWGEACVNELLGDFAFVVWDRPQRKLFCARDPLGVRPLYYALHCATFRCASEMHPLFADGDLPRGVSEDGAALFLTSQYAERDQTLYEGVYALPPGHRLVVRDRAFRIDAYWSPPPWGRIRYLDDASYAEHFHEKLSLAVSCRLRAIGPIAAELSGGLDSSSVVCEVERLRRTGSFAFGPLTCLSLLFPGLDCDESDYSESVARHLGARRITTDPPRDPRLCRPAQAHPDVYFDPTIRMFEPLLRCMQAEGTRVILTGLGGDLLLRRTGFETTSAFKRGNFWEAMRNAGVFPRVWSPRAWRSLARGLHGIFAWEARRDHVSNAAARWPWLAPALATRAQEHARKMRRRMFDLHPDPVQAAMMHEITYGPDTVLVLSVNDRLGASFGVEHRHPFLDVRVVETLLAFPHEQRWTPGLSKPVLRRVMAGVWPRSLRARRAITVFDSYLTRCFLQGHRPHIDLLLRRSRLEEYGIVDGEWLRRALSDRGREIPLLDLVRLLALETWLRGTIGSNRGDVHEDKCDSCG
jgi:asparagine synthase (glutamine-hydrolysing)